MPTRTFEGRTLDARPDRVDYRDLPYRAALRSLPDKYPDPDFIRAHFERYGEAWILDQKNEGACTGFGLAAVINYLLWKKHLEAASTIAIEGNEEHELRQDAVWKTESAFDPAGQQVSMRMLYQMARLYDEWPGEDYDGSSCRGAMKGWHRHGVCTNKKWRYETVRYIKPTEGWQKEAARCPLGTYYRINKDSLPDLQAAILEVGAIYVSAYLHKGWFPDANHSSAEVDNLPILEMDTVSVGGHAFAIVGYNAVGFVVQNSWGPSWGNTGFAVLTYEDWVANGADAWVAVLGAPMTIEAGVRTRSSSTLTDQAGGKADWFWDPTRTGAGFQYTHDEVRPWSEERAYEHTLVLGNEGIPQNRFLDLRNATDAVKEVALTRPREWIESVRTKPRIAIYAHGGLNDEATSLRRVRILAPYFKANGIYPLFLTWRTGFLESIEGILGDAISKIFPMGDRRPVRGWGDAVREQISEAKDRSIEAACDQVLVKPVWEQMRQNAAASTRAGRGTALLARHLRTLMRSFPELEIHLIGHSAGSILLGHLLDMLTGGRLPVASLTLYAPACTVPFALEHYVPAWEAGVLKRAHFDLLSDEREQADSVSIYGKSLLYLVSRALETVHKMPLLGMENAWRSELARDELWHAGTIESVERWQAFASEHRLVPHVHGPAPGTGDDTRSGHNGGDEPVTHVWDGQSRIPLAHGSFDNDVAVVTRTLQRIRGSQLRFPVENLHGF